MGGAFFILKNGDDIEDEDLNDMFNTKSESMRLRANSKIVRSWGHVPNVDDLYLNTI